MKDKYNWAVVAIANYLVLFLICPFILLELTNEVICTVGVVLWTVGGAVLFSGKAVRPGQFLLQSLLFYPLVMLYHPKGIYGIHTGGSLDGAPAWVDALVFVILISVSQFIVGRIYARIKK